MSFSHIDGAKIQSLWHSNITKREGMFDKRSDFVCELSRNIYLCAADRKKYESGNLYFGANWQVG